MTNARMLPRGSTPGNPEGIVEFWYFFFPREGNISLEQIICLWYTFPSLACIVESINAHGSYWPSILCPNGLRWYYFTSQATFDGNGLKFHIECATKYKTAYPLWFGPLRAAIVLCHPDSLRVILTNHVPKEEFVYSLLLPFLGKQVNLRKFHISSSIFVFSSNSLWLLRWPPYFPSQLSFLVIRQRFTHWREALRDKRGGCWIVRYFL